jgi:hypothetical protein
VCAMRFTTSRKIAYGTMAGIVAREGTCVRGAGPACCQMPARAAVRQRQTPRAYAALFGVSNRALVLQPRLDEAVRRRSCLPFGDFVGQCVGDGEGRYGSGPRKSTCTAMKNYAATPKQGDRAVSSGLAVPARRRTRRRVLQCAAWRLWCSLIAVDYPNVARCSVR